MSVLEALVSIQAQLKSPKDQNAGRYRYRNIEDINQAVKPLAAAHGCAVVYTDEFIDGVCISTCTLLGSDDSISAKGCAFLNLSPKIMSIEQSSGAASSYARKYAACGLFAIDSSENDPDRTNAQPTKKQPSKGKSTGADTALANAQKRITAIAAKRAELDGITTAQWYELHIKTRSDYANDAETLNRIAQELEEEWQSTLSV